VNGLLAPMAVIVPFLRVRWRDLVNGDDSHPHPA
jgi:hypothetical protein